MGVNYTIYHPATRTCFSLGKYLAGNRKDADMPFEENRAAAFIATRPFGEFVLCNDMTGGLDCKEECSCTSLVEIGRYRRNPWIQVTWDECAAMIREGKTQDIYVYKD
jgi:hypothetical protein